MSDTDKPEVFTHGDKRKLDEIHSALVGNDSLGQKGLVKRIEYVENHVSSVENLKMKIIGGILALSAAGSAIGAKLVAMFNDSPKH